MRSDGTIGRRSPEIRRAQDADRRELVTRLYEVAELLSRHPRAECALVRAGVRELRALYQASGVDHGLLALLLHNMVQDLGCQPASFPASYYARQITTAADQLAAAG